MQNYQVLQIFRDDSQKPPRWYNKGEVISPVGEVASRLIEARVIAPMLDGGKPIVANLPQKPVVETATADKNPKIERREIKPKAEAK